MNLSKKIFATALIIISAVLDYLSTILSAITLFVIFVPANDGKH